MNKQNGFTLIELLVVIAILGILAATLLPALAKSKQQTQAVYCMNNCKQLMMAWLGYTHDFNDKIVYSLHGSAAQGGAGYTLNGQIVHGWASGWLDWTTATDNTNIIFLTNSKYALLAPYLSGSKNVFKCPADNFLSAPQRALGWSGRCRSFSGNVFLGNGNTTSGPRGAIYTQCIKMSDLQIPGPRETWAFCEEHPDSMNDPEFYPPNSSTYIVDTPATYHNKACGFAFTDGHAEIHRWKGILTGGAAATVTYVSSSGIVTSTTDQDLYWLSYHSPRFAGVAGTPY